MYNYLNYPYIKDLQKYYNNLERFSPGIHNIVDYPEELLKLIDYFAIGSFIQRVDLLVVHPTEGRKESAHVDVADYRYSLNIPIAGYTNSSTVFFKPNTKVHIDKRSDLIKDEDGTIINTKMFYFPITEKSEVIGDYPTQDVFLMDTQVPHTVRNPNSENRYTILVRLNKNYKVE